MNKPAAKPGLQPIQREVMWHCAVTFLVNGAIAISPGTLMPYLRQSYGFTYALSGTLISLHAVGNLIASFLAGVLPFKLGRRRSAGLLALAGALCYGLLLVCGGSLPLLCLAFLCSGLARGSATNAGNTAVNNSFPGQVWAMNLQHAIYAVGAFSLPFVVMVFATRQADGWRVPAAVMCALCLAQSVSFFTLNMPDEHPKKQTGGSNWGFLKLPRFQLACGILVLYMCVEQGVNGWLVTYFKDSGLMSDAFAQSLTSILWVFILAGRLTCATVSTRMKKENLLCLTAVGYALFYGVLMFSRQLGPITVCIVGLGFCMAGIYPTATSMMGDICGVYPLAMSILLTITGIGAIVMPSVIGWVAESFGITAGMYTMLAAVAVDLVLIFRNAAVMKAQKTP